MEPARNRCLGRRRDLGLFGAQHSQTAENTSADLCLPRPDSLLVLIQDGDVDGTEVVQKQQNCPMDGLQLRDEAVASPITLVRLPGGMGIQVTATILCSQRRRLSRAVAVVVTLDVHAVVTKADRDAWVLSGGPGCRVASAISIPKQLGNAPCIQSARTEADPGEVVGLGDSLRLHCLGSRSRVGSVLGCSRERV